MEGNPRVLLGETEEHIGYLVKFHLEKSGLEVIWKLDGRSTLDAARSERPALAVLDTMMPRLTGFEVLQQLKSDPETRAIPVIMLSALGSEAELVKGFTLGAADYIVKPFGTGELLARVRRLLPREAPPRAS